MGVNDMSDAFLVERLLGNYPRGPIQHDGEPEFGWQSFHEFVSPIQIEAAEEITRLQKERDALKAENEKLKKQLLPGTGSRW